MEGALDIVCHVHGESLLDEIETELCDRAPLLYCQVGDFFKTTLIREYPRYEDSWLYLFVVKEKYGDRVVVESVDASLRSPRHIATEFTMRPLFDRPWSSDTPLRIDVAPHESFFFIPATSDDEGCLDTFGTHEEADVLCDMWDAFLKRSSPNTSLFAWPSSLPIEYSLCRIGWIESLLEEQCRILFEDEEGSVFKLTGLWTPDWEFAGLHTEFFVYGPRCKLIGEEEFHEYYDEMSLLDIESVQFVCMRSPYVGDDTLDFDFDLSSEFRTRVEYEDGLLTIPVAKLHHVKLVVKSERSRYHRFQECAFCSNLLDPDDAFGSLPFRHGPIQVVDDDEKKLLCMFCVDRVADTGDVSYCQKCDVFHFDCCPYEEPV